MLGRWEIREWLKKGKTSSGLGFISKVPKLWRPYFNFFAPMRTAFNPFAFLVLIASAFTGSGQTTSVPPPTPFSVIHRETNERTWQRTKYVSSQAGQMVPETQSYEEVGNCICYRGQNGWEDSENSISILPDGSGSSTDAPCKIYIPPDIYNGVVRIVTADGLELESEPIGLWFSDNAATVQIATLTNSIGEMVSSKPPEASSAWPVTRQLVRATDANDKH
jgi:hypothetical protein